MIIAQVLESRSFIGCLDAGCDLTGSLLALGKDKGIDTAFVTGYGYVTDPVLSMYSLSEGRYMEPRKQPGTYLFSSVSGSLSPGEDGEPELQIFGTGAASGRGRTRSVAGRFVSGTVVQFEFFLRSVDNVVLKRLVNEETGLHLWLQLLPVGAEATRSVPTVASVRKPLIRSSRLDDEEMDEDLSFNEGDWLDHPRLGMCRILLHDGEDRIKVRLGSGRIAELLVPMFKLSLSGVKDGGKVYKVEMRKRT